MGGQRIGGAVVGLLVLVLVGGALPVGGAPPASAAPGRTSGSEWESVGTRAERMDALVAQARRDGDVRVVVRLASDFVPEGRLDDEARASQRAAFARHRAHLASVLRGTAHQQLRTYDSVPYVALEVSSAAVEVLRRSPVVADVHADEQLEPALADNLDLVDVDSLGQWSSGDAGAGYTVAVLDTGVDRDHPVFEGRIVDEGCYSGTGGQSGIRTLCPNGETVEVGPGAGVHCTVVPGTCAHGTHVAGIAAGVAPGADIMPVQVFSAKDCGAEPCVTAWRSDILAGLEHVLDRAATRDVAAVNLSLGSLTDRPCDDDPLKPMIDNLRSVGVATVVAAGNDGLADEIAAPACISTAVAVGSTTVPGDEVSDFSNNHPTMLDLLAPGEPIESALPGGRTGWMSGTSMAAPHVAGAWALLHGLAPDVTVSTALGWLQAVGPPVEDFRASEPYAHPRLGLSGMSLGLQLDPPRCLTDPFDDVGAGHTFCVEIAWLAETGISAGYRDGTFRSGNEVTRQALAAFLYRQAGAPAVAVDGAPFADVSTDHPFVEAITWMDEQGISTGYDDGTFRPGNEVTRQAVAAFLYRQAGAPAVAVDGAPFADVSSGHPFVEAITWMDEQGISTGYDDGTFCPGTTVTRQAVAAFLNRVR